jgi:hypothetical protein
VPLIAIVLLVALAFVLPAGAGASQDRDRWRRPLSGAVVGSFSFDPAAPYERGRRRGIDFADDPGTAVVAACSGRVTHAGGVPAWESGVTVRCGSLVATQLGLERVRVRRGQRVMAGALVGVVGGRGVLRLGARWAGRPHGYVDPAALLAGDAPWSPGPAPVASRRPRGRGMRPLLRGVRPAEAPAPVVDAKPDVAPWAAWAGLALVLTAATRAGATAGRRRAGGRPVEAAVAGR